MFLIVHLNPTILNYVINNIYKGLSEWRLAITLMWLTNQNRAVSSSAKNKKNIHQGSGKYKQILLYRFCNPGLAYGNELGDWKRVLKSTFIQNAAKGNED